MTGIIPGWLQPGRPPVHCLFERQDASRDLQCLRCLVLLGQGRIWGPHRHLAGRLVAFETMLFVYGYCRAGAMAMLVNPQK